MAEQPTEVDITLAHHLARLADTANHIERQLAEPRPDGEIHPVDGEFT